MSAVQRKSTLMLPLRIVFTEEGSSQFMSKNTKLKKMKLADNTEEFGIETNSIAPSLLQRMFLADYISKLEISMPEFSSSRQDILDLSKLTVYGVLYKQMDKMILSQIFETEILKKYNRVNPAQMFDSKTQMSTSSLRAKMLVMESQYQRVKDEILKPIRGKILARKDITIEEKNVSLLLAEKYMDNLSLYTWYLILRFFKGEDEFKQIQGIVQPVLENFMEKSQIAEYIALMLMELAINSENNNFRKEAKIMYRGIMDETQAIYDPDIRKKIISEITRKREFVSISWRFGGGSTSIGTQNRLQIMLYNKEDVYDQLKENIDNQKATASNEKSLIDFYNTSNAQDDTSLGLYYLSYLSEACQKVNVKFDSLVNQFSTNDLTVITLSFNF